MNVKIDYEKLATEVRARGKTNGWLSVQIAKDRGYITKLKDKAEIPDNVENLICMVLGVEKGTYILPEPKEESKPQGEITVLNNLHKDVKSLLSVMENLADGQEKIWNKLNTNTIQLARIKDYTKVLEKDEYDRAVDFLKSALADGKVNGEEVLLRADSAGIKRADLNKAKNTVGIDTSVTGYGKNQKTWWFIPK